MQDLKIEIWPIAKVKPNPDNPRRISPDKMAKLVRSIQDFPEMLKLRPVIVNAEGIALGGNMRRAAALKAGLKELPVIQASNLTEEQQKEFILKDNVSFGEWEWEQLREGWGDIQLEEWGLDVPDFGDIAEEPQAYEDNYVPDEVIKTKIKEGDIITIGPHRLACGDCADYGLLAKLMGNDKADAVLTDPPYNVDYSNKNKHLNRNIGGGRSENAIQNDNLEAQAFYDFLLERFKALNDFTKAGGAWYVWHADSEGTNFRSAFQDAGIMLKQCLVWVKNNIVIGRQDYQWRHEPCLYGWKPGAAHYFTEDRTNQTTIEDREALKQLSKKELLERLTDLLETIPSSIIHCDKPHRSELHSTMKPVLLFSPLIENSTRKNAIVLDGFAGSGTTFVAAEQLGRIAYGVELEPKHCQSIVDRMRLINPDLLITLNGKEYGG